jgi:uncharacterized tellurite resistance protein B-like protein|tara:strand:- start:14 stop:445 length:432 start_codon:yes stop_codon:yes gene_type:complete
MLKLFSKMKERQELTDDEKHILIVSILIECAKGDNDFSDDEILKIKNVIKHKLHVDDDKLNFIFDSALEMTEGNVELYSLTKDIRDHFDKDEILEIFEYMWSVMLADGEIDDYESALMTKLVGLFHLTGKESAEAKKKAMSQN